MAGLSPAIANEFIRLADAEGRTLTQMQLQKLVYIAHGWNLAINGAPLTVDEPQAWDYGPVYPELWKALRSYGREPVERLIKYRDYMPFASSDKVAEAELEDHERALIERVYSDYGKFPAFKLSALTHRDGTPWTQVYDDGAGKFDEIPADKIREHFVDLARTRRAAAHA